MNVNPLPSRAENEAVRAQAFHLFSKFNLVGVRNDLGSLLVEIGRNGIFSEYTRHDITHIDTLLGMLEWVVINSTAKLMTPVDWMLIVLSIYFHDAGLVVNQAEYDRREESDFPAFRNKVLSGPEPTPYRERILRLADDERERFLYQEFVRTHHANRIKCWINGDPYAQFGVATEAREVVHGIVAPLDASFRGDLALVCESHHLDDLIDLEKYNPRRAYGSDLGETANLQFSAILLRTVDLLHVTKDRTPSVSFQLTNPSDPKSVEEWSKQMPVVSVRSALPRDASGKVEPEAVADTVAITATFHDPLGFFSLTEYLFYAGLQLKQSHQWVEQTNTKEALEFEFPWRKIDTSQVKAVGFESKQFAFELDKPKILNLLAGHTLYSNSNVVVRELAQNSLDAIRLQSAISGGLGTISLHLDSKAALLTIDDNGTGMTQRVIEDHFLNVGSSRYRDDTFRKQYPAFSAISRFGIGILSTFMISDEIEVITRAAAEPRARNISIRSINGNYLIRLIELNDPKVPSLIKNHGTRIQLKIRAGVPLPDLRQIATFWIVFPGCAVSVQVDDEPPTKIGYDSPKQALESALTSAGIPLSTKEPDGYTKAFRVVERVSDGLALAFALEWFPAYRNWGFVDARRLSVSGQAPGLVHATGVCVHGVRVENSSPGFKGQTILAISNMSGPKSPATNVARSSLEAGTLVDEMFGKVFDIYAGHVSTEIVEMSKVRGTSISKAASEGRYLLWPLQTSGQTTTDHDAALRTSLTKIPFLTLDRDGERSLVSVAGLDKENGFWSIEGGTYTSSQHFIDTMPTGVSLAKLAALSTESLQLPDGDIVSGFSVNATISGLLFEGFEVDRIEIRQIKKQVDFHWRARSGAPIWRNILPRGKDTQRVAQLLAVVSRNMPIGPALTSPNSFLLQDSSSLRTDGVAGEIGIKGASVLYLFSGNDIHTHILNRLHGVEDGKETIEDYVFTALALTWSFLRPEEPSIGPTPARVVEQLRQIVVDQTNIDIHVTAELRSLLERQQCRLFDPSWGERKAVTGPLW